QSRRFPNQARRQDDVVAAILAKPPEAGAMGYAERIRGSSEQHPFPQGPVTATLGVAAFPADAAAAEDLMAKAEHALNEAKARGRNRIGQLWNMGGTAMAPQPPQRQAHPSPAVGAAR